MDLTRSYPRSPNAELGGIVMLGRTIDKARAFNAGKLGEYSYDCPLDRALFEFLGISAGDLAEAVRTRPSDAEILGWVRSKERPHAPVETAEFNAGMRARGPVTEEQKAYFREALEKADPGRTGIRTWFDLIDADEKRLT